jgi:hypothetical protein
LDFLRCFPHTKYWLEVSSLGAREAAAEICGSNHHTLVNKYPSCMLKLFIRYDRVSYGIGYEQALPTYLLFLSLVPEGVAKKPDPFFRSKS